MGLFGRKKKKADVEVIDDNAEGEEASTDAPASAEEVDSTGADSPSSETSSEPIEAPSPGTYRPVRVSPGARGWGSGFVVEPKDGKNLIYSVTGGGIHPVAQRIADLSGGVPFDGFKSKAGFDEIACAVIDCGGTARIGVYPMKGVLTIDIHGASPSGPLMRFINEENFVSGVGVDDVVVLDD